MEDIQSRSKENVPEELQKRVTLIEASLLQYVITRVVSAAEKLEPAISPVIQLPPEKHQIGRKEFFLSTPGIVVARVFATLPHPLASQETPIWELVRYYNFAPEKGALTHITCSATGYQILKAIPGITQTSAYPLIYSSTPRLIIIPQSQFNPDSILLTQAKVVPDIRVHIDGEQCFVFVKPPGVR